MTPDHFADPAFVARYAEGPPKFLPGYAVMQQMAAQLLAEGVGSEGELLVMGAGGGLELSAFSDRQSGWRFTAIDPSVEMLRAAETLLGERSQRVRWIVGLIDDAPAGPFDGASCLLTLHFVPDDGRKLATLRAIHARLKPSAPFVVVDQCIDTKAPDFERWLDRYARFAIDSGADRQLVAEAAGRLRSDIHTVNPAREAVLLAEAGFNDVALFFAGLSWRGWVARA